MPKTTKGMQSFLRAALCFKSHVVNYSDHVAKLYKMTHKDFKCDRKTWKEDYEGDFEAMKDVLVSSIADHFSDNSLEWGLGVDASNVAIGAGLCQIRVAEDCTKTYEAIGLASTKFSDTAMSWDTMKKKATHTTSVSSLSHTISEGKASYSRQIIITFCGSKSQYYLS